MRRTLFISFIALLTISFSAWSEVPTKISYQGYICSSSGSPLEGSHVFSFKLFDASVSGNLLWEDTDTLEVDEGQFHAFLGDNTPLNPSNFLGQTLWLETSVDDNLLPGRQAVVSVGYAFKAMKADTATVALNVPSSGDSCLWETDGTHVWRSSGNVGIGVEDPSYKLEISTTGSGLMISDSEDSDNLRAYIGYSPQNGGIMRLSNMDEQPMTIIRGYPIDGVQAYFMAGNVGFGTNAPTSIIHIYNNSDDQGYYSGIQIDQEGSGDAALSFRTVGQQRIIVGIDNSDDDKFKITDASSFGTGDRLVIDVNGNVGIGDPSPSERLEVNGNATVSGNLCVLGTKNRVVPDAKYGNLYYNAVESGTADFTDRGSDRLTEGQCHVELNGKWLAGVTISEQYPMTVWITFYGPHGDYYVKRGLTSFDVVDPSGSSVDFDWKVEARQKGYEEVYLNQKK